MVPNIEYDYILLLGYRILYKEYYLTRFNHPKEHCSCCFLGEQVGQSERFDGHFQGLLGLIGFTRTVVACTMVSCMC